MSRLSLLRMAFLLAEMIRIATIERPMTLSTTIKRSRPSLVLSLALPLILSLRTRQRFLNSATVAFRVDQKFATAANAFMTAPFTLMLSTRK
jgi:hypothetical protein